MQTHIRAHARTHMRAHTHTFTHTHTHTGASAMRLLKGAYSCLCLVKDVGLVAFRDPHGIR